MTKKKKNEEREDKLMKKIHYFRISKIIIITIILLIITGCDFLGGLDKRKKIGDISSNIIYDGKYIIFCKEYYQNSASGYYTLGQAMYCVELSTGEINSKLIEYENRAYILYAENAHDVYLSKTNNNVYLSSSYLSSPWKYSLNNKTWSEVEDSVLSKAFILDYSPDENELIYIDRCEYVYYIDNITNEIKKYPELTLDYYMPFTVNWDERIIVHISSQYINFIDIDTDSTCRVDISEVKSYPIISRIKWFGNDILIDYFDETEMLQVSYIDSTWQSNKLVEEKYYYMANDSSYCDIKNELYSIIISIYNKNDDLIQTIEVREEIE